MKENNPENWICQIKAMLSQDIYQTSGKSLAKMKNYIQAKVLVIVATRDAMVNPHSAMEFAKALNFNYVELTGDCGHLAPGCEDDKVRKEIKEFL